MTTIADHDAYITAAPEAFRPSLKSLRALLARTLPEAEEMVAYNMPGFRIGGSIVASYAAFSKQCGVYFLPGAIAEHAEEIAAAGLKSGVVTSRPPCPAPTRRKPAPHGYPSCRLWGAQADALVPRS